MSQEIIYIADARLERQLRGEAHPVLTSDDVKALYSEVQEAARRLRLNHRAMFDYIKVAETRSYRQAVIRTPHSHEAELTLSDTEIAVKVFASGNGEYIYAVDTQGNLYHCKKLRSSHIRRTKSDFTLVWFKVDDLRWAAPGSTMMRGQVLPALRQLGA